jgi:hypothetical protein
MSYFHRSAELDGQPTESPEPVHAGGSRLTDFKGRIARALSPPERARPGRVYSPAADLEEEPYDVVDDVSGIEHDTRFPIGPLGYNRSAVDAHVAELERQIGQLRQAEAPMSISEELERLGEQTASILVVAHDKAHETTRLAREQAEQCIADAAANAVEMTRRAKQQLVDLDEETDAVWRERARLIDDARDVGRALIMLADEAAERFPEDVKSEQTHAFGPVEEHDAVPPDDEFISVETQAFAPFDSEDFRPVEEYDFTPPEPGEYAD